MKVVYLDRVFLINVLIDYLLLLSTVRLSGKPLHRPRMILCSLFGGLYSVAVFFPFAHFLALPVCRLLAGILMAGTAFFCFPRPFHLVALFLLLSCVLGGAVLAVGLAAGSTYEQVHAAVYHARFDTEILLCSTVGIYILLRLIFRQGARHVGGEILEITVVMNGSEEKVKMQGLYDTGNTLRDPINGSPVLVVEQSALLRLWDKHTASILQQNIPAEEKMVLLYRHGNGCIFTLLPFRSVGVSAGLLLAVRSDYVQVGTQVYPNTLIALSAGPLSDGGTYQALWGGEEGRGTHEVMASTLSMDCQTQQAG